MKTNKRIGDTNITENAKEVLVFDAYGRLSAIFKSVYSAGACLVIQPQAISNACVGRVISSSGLYFRHLHPDIVIESTDLGELKVQEYDKVTKEYRPYKKSSVLNRERELFINRLTNEDKSK